MREKLDKLIDFLEKYDYNVNVNDLESCFGKQDKTFVLGFNKRIWIYEDNFSKTMVHLTIEFNGYSDNVKIMNLDVFQVGGYKRKECCN